MKFLTQIHFIPGSWYQIYSSSLIPWPLKPIIPMPLSSRRRTFSVSAAHLHEPAACEEAREVLSEAEGRWWAFNLEDPTTLIILERKHIPDHLKELPNLEVAVTFQSLLVDLQDLGEAFRVTSGLLKFECFSPHRGSTLEEYSYSHSDIVYPLKTC